MSMSRIFVLLLIGLPMVLGCNKETQAEIDRELIQDYIQSNNLQAEEDASGLFYTIDVPGDTEKPVLADSVVISYRGTLLSGLEFDATDDGETATFLLDDLIEGVEVDGLRYGRIEADLERGSGKNRWIQLTLTEGKNREVRRVLEHLGLKVNRLLRTAYGPFELADLPRGQAVEIRQADVERFRKQLKRGGRL